MKTPELLSPAGTIKNMRYAFAYGADAVYAGMPRYSLRVRENDFLEDNLRIGIDEAHSQGRQFFVATNVMPHGSKLKTFLDDIEPVVDMGPDALIMADPGLIMMVRERWPDMPIHLSVQANTTNAAGVKFWQSIGLSRVILSRELSLDEVAEKCAYHTVGRRVAPQPEKVMRVRKHGEDTFYPRDMKVVDASWRPTETVDVIFTDE